jgi:hypothetical protein
VEGIENKKAHNEKGRLHALLLQGPKKWLGVYFCNFVAKIDAQPVKSK